MYVCVCVFYLFINIQVECLVCSMNFVLNEIYQNKDYCRKKCVCLVRVCMCICVVCVRVCVCACVCVCVNLYGPTSGDNFVILTA